jgi:hypothetical protein
VKSSPNATSAQADLGARRYVFDVYERARPFNRCSVTDLNAHRALVVGSLRLGLSADKLRVERRGPASRFS